MCIEKSFNHFYFFLINNNVDISLLVSAGKELVAVVGCFWLELDLELG